MANIKPGEWIEVRDPTPDDQKLADQVKEDVIKKIGHKVRTFKVVKVSTQVVQGINYLFKVDVGDNEYIHILIYEDLQHKVELIDVKEGETKDSPLEPF